MFTRDYTSPRRSTHGDSIQRFRSEETRDGRGTALAMTNLLSASLLTVTILIKE
jgi:hypothetical protein